MITYSQLVYSHPTSRPCTTSAPFVKKSEATDSQWPLITSTKCFLQMQTTHRVTTGVDWFGTVFLNTKKQSRTLPKLLDSTKQMQFTGITAPVAIATLECKFISPHPFSGSKIQSTISTEPQSSTIGTQSSTQIEAWCSARWTNSSPPLRTTLQKSNTGSRTT